MFWVQMLLLINLLVLAGCGTQSKAGAYADKTKEEEALEALEAEDFAKAIELYLELIEEDPENYPLYRYLASAYASSAGFDIIEAIKGTSSGGGSLLDTLGKFVPSDPSADQIEEMRAAKEAILTMPIEHRSKDSTEFDYASGAAMQLEFYQAAYSIMYINKFAQVNATGTLDQERLQSMTDEDVDQILNNLTDVAANGSTGVPAAAQSVLAKVDAEEGESRRDRLISYLNKSKASGS